MLSHVSFAYCLKKVSSDSNFIVYNEDDIVIFPSKTLRSTDQIKTNNDRISVSGDIIFLAKDTNTLEHLTPSFENWKKL